MTNDTTRDAFEAWFTDGVVNARLQRVGDGYTLATSQISWIAWQAATEQGKRQPLSDDEISDIGSGYNTGRAQGEYDFARAIEAAHEITATSQGKI